MQDYDYPMPDIINIIYNVKLGGDDSRASYDRNYLVIHSMLSYQPPLNNSPHRPKHLKRCNETFWAVIRK